MRSRFLSPLLLVWTLLPACGDSRSTEKSDADATAPDASEDAATTSSPEDAGAEADSSTDPVEDSSTGPEEAGSDADDADVDAQGSDADAGSKPDASDPFEGEVSELTDDEIQNRLATIGGHTCALRRSGLYCWGDNFAGQLGDGTLEASDEPVRAALSVKDIVEVEAATGRTCVRHLGGEVSCWGLNDKGQAGDGTREDALTPVKVSGIDDAIQIAIDGASSCALLEDKSVKCWGGLDDDSGLSPRTIEGVEGAVEVRGGVTGLYCARSAEGWVRCWTLEDGAWTEPTEVEELAGANAVGVFGGDEVCAITEATDVRCYNFTLDTTGPLGDSEGSVELVDTQLIACTANAEGLWRCWNVNHLEIEMFGSYPLPFPEGAPADLVEVAVGGFSVCGSLQDNRVACANANDDPPTLVFVEGLPE